MLPDTSRICPPDPSKTVSQASAGKAPRHQLQRAPRLELIGGELPGSLGEGSAQLEWGDRTKSDPQLLAAAGQAAPPPPSVRYLSQQFVDRLCSSDNLGREL